jgi:amino acid transporter
LTDQVQLVRVIGVLGVAFASFNGIVGAGIFGIPGLVAGVLGPAAILAYVVCLILVGLVGLCFAEAGSRVSASGGLYAYVSVAFGPIAGGVAGALIVFANLIGSAAALSRYFLDTLAQIFPGLANPVAGFAALATVYGLLAAMNVRGARNGARLTVVVGLVKLTPLLFLVAVGLMSTHWKNLEWTAAPSIGQVGTGAMILVFAFLGIENGSYVCGEVRNPARTIPRGILVSVILVAFLYVGLQFAAQGVLGPALANAQSPLVDTARAVLGPPGEALILGAILLSAGGYFVADMLCSPRVVFALAQAGQLPRGLAAIHTRHCTPHVAISFYAATVILVAVSGTFRQIVVLSTAGSLLIYLMVCLAVLRLRVKGVAQAGTPFVAPGGFLAPVAAAGIIVWLMSTLERDELLATLAFVAAAAGFYAAGLWLRRRPRRDDGAFG